MDQAGAPRPYAATMEEHWPAPAVWPPLLKARAIVRQVRGVSTLGALALGLHVLVGTLLYREQHGRLFNHKGTRRGEGRLWVQCTRSECGKWRVLPPGSRLPAAEEDWFCTDNPDPAKARSPATIAPKAPVSLG